MQVGLFSLFGIVFVALKLMGFIDWTWVWVLAPFWIGAILWVLVVILFIIAKHYTNPLRTPRKPKK